tara:strand:- start:39 stop:821 length:783 start_codon:yes stop_codon:yes gene_type:complete
VTTYLPVIGLILRALGLIAVLEGGHVFGIGAAALACGGGAVCYWDAHWNRGSRLCVVCGGLVPVCGTMLFARILVSNEARPTCMGMEGFVLSWVFDIAWSVASSFHLVAAVWQPVYTHRHLPLLWTLLAVAKVWALCEPLSVYQIPARATLYYITCMLYLYSAPFLPALDRNAHRAVTPHLGLHLLVVQPYVLAASVAVFACVLARLYTTGVGLLPGLTPAAERSLTERSKSASRPAASSATEDSALEQLRQAKAQNQAV